MSYTAWPTATDVRNLIGTTNVSLSSGVSDTEISYKVDAAVQAITKQAQRQFLKGSTGEQRNFDGSGTGILIVDDYILISAITILTLPSYATISLQGYYAVTNNLFANNEIQIIQGPATALYQYWSAFPVGRSNIQITGQWGYGATIPADVWGAVREKAAREIIMAQRHDQAGLIDSIKDGDSTVGYSDKSFDSLFGGDKAFMTICQQYQRPLRLHLNRAKTVLI